MRVLALLLLVSGGMDVLPKADLIEINHCSDACGSPRRYRIKVFHIRR